MSLDDYLPKSLKGKVVPAKQKQDILDKALIENVHKGNVAKIKELIDLGAGTKRVFRYTWIDTHKESIDALLEKGVKITPEDIRDVIQAAISTMEVRGGLNDKDWANLNKKYAAEVKLLLDAASREAFIGTYKNAYGVGETDGHTISDVVYNSGLDVLRTVLDEALKKHGLKQSDLRGSQPVAKPGEAKHSLPENTYVSDRTNALRGKLQGSFNDNPFMQEKVWADKTKEVELYRKLLGAVQDFKLEDVQKFLGKGAKVDADLVWYAVRHAAENTELLSDPQAQDEMGWRGADTLNLAKKYGQVAAAILSAATKREDLTGTNAEGKTIADLVKTSGNPWMELGLKDAYAKTGLTEKDLSIYTGKHRASAPKL